MLGGAGRLRSWLPSSRDSPELDPDAVEGVSPRTRSQVWAALARFAGLGLIALLAVTAGTVVIAEKASREGMLRAAERTARDIADTVVAPLAGNALRERDPEAMERLDGVMSARMADGSLLEVTVWSADSVVVWSDDERLIGRRFPAEPQHTALVTTLGSAAELTSLEPEENVDEVGEDDVAEVHLGFVDSSGTPLLLELHIPVAGLEAESRAQLQTLLPVTVGGPALLLLVLLPLALSMARRIDRAGAQRSALLRRSVAASAMERRRIAADLHDGVVQDLAGIGYALPAIVATLPDGPDGEDARQKLNQVTEIVKGDVTSLRSVITDIYPPDLHQGGLVTAAQLLVSEVRYAGIEVELHVDPGVTDRALPIDAAVLGYRVLRETLRNVTRHSGAATARVALRAQDGDLLIEVSDDGVGFDSTVPAPEGHFGLRLLQDTLNDVGGGLSIGTPPDGGTEVVARFPIRWGAPA